MKKTFLFMACITLLIKIIALFREVALSYFFGLSNVTDAYFISLVIPTIIFSFIGVGIKTAFLPIYSRISKYENKKAGLVYTNTLINIFVIITFLINIIIWLNIEAIVKVFAVGFEGETLNLAVKLTRITVVTMLFLPIIYVLEGFLNSKKSFLLPIISTLPLNIWMIFSYYFAYNYGLTYLGFGQVLGVFTQLILIIFLSYKYGYRYNFDLDYKSENLNRSMKLIIPVMFSSAVNQINKLIDKTIASTMSDGGISALNYASRINKLVDDLFIVSLATIFFANISKLAAANNIAKLKTNLNEAIKLTLLLLIPASVGMMLFSKEIVQLIYGRGAFDSSAVAITGSALFFYTIGLAFLGLRHIIIKVFYALEDSKTPVINTIIALLINIILNLILSKYMGVAGLALATSIVDGIIVFSLITALQKKIGSIGVLNILKGTTKIILASIIMGGSSLLLFYSIVNLVDQNLALILSILCGALVYYSTSILIKIPEAIQLNNMIIERFKK
ncbi:murein biosynthesis integral membrane protein MurJ [Pseudalkalibacillus hwajinpoensis]|uniref:Probable lipid II flippase MurJ n=1 Tax=Guptibacillus hwajinpoensis TaxID=208199 RepID=A0A4U1MJP3_9BACL|nr:murein biosynthesis integral membrane protein MurJ [Pseudalkalibacillus hwajinpoensis]TKD70736.1 murein biosynthesis integral membrane protein MurJ [Pseudalkalibacillus hwajinpoensis]